jgi:glycerophosphoryl diester phosphodiesterase
MTHIILFLFAAAEIPLPLGACAHRGDVKHFPENTLPAFASAVAKGAHMIEFDVYLTKDGIPVVIHDTTVDRTTDGTGNVTDYLFEDLRKLDAGNWLDPRFAGTRIPTLEETLAVIPHYILCNVHLKNAAGLAATVAEIIKQEDRLDHCFLACSIEQAREAKKVVPTIKICNMSVRRGTLSAYVEATHEFGAEYLQVHYKAQDHLAEELHRARELGIVANYFYADEPEEIRRVADAGVHYILTNDLDTCLAVLQRTYGISPAREPVQE